ncbi:MAG: helix-turn-helix domain-containing protein [Candidatus Burarchaeum sp.]|nr:helix-turn-helix domain-containing protein [Candidatus Burarchaeum sp.]MDO8339788.1 helix-turn-helix domain-containing protein [Candidatus Burarchaeum sp.]
MEPKDLEKLGLSKAESLCYFALLQMGQTTTGPLSKQTRLHKPTVYAALEGLIEKGLATYVIRNNTKQFQAAPPMRLLEYAGQKEAEAHRTKQELFENLKSLQVPAAPSKGRSAQVYEGWNGMKTAFEDLPLSLHKGDRLLVYGVGRLGRDERFLRLASKMDERLSRRGVRSYFVIDEQLRDTMGKVYEKKAGTEVRYLHSSYSTPAAFNVYADKVLITIWTGIPTGILLQGEEIAESFRSHFEIIWKLAKKAQQ